MLSDSCFLLSDSFLRNTKISENQPNQYNLCSIALLDNSSSNVF